MATTATAIDEGANCTGGVMVKIGESLKVVETKTAMVVKSLAVVQHWLNHSSNVMSDRRWLKMLQ